jgi:hypothetical protein
LQSAAVVSTGRCVSCRLVFAEHMLPSFDQVRTFHCFRCILNTSGG